MPANKNALIRYKTIDNCLRNKYRRWTLDDLVDACCAALYEMEGISKGVSVRTVQSDIQLMRSDKLGYNAPIEVYDHKYYRYTAPDFSITNMPLSDNDYAVMQEAVDMLSHLEYFEQFAEMTDVVRRLQDKLQISKNRHKPIIHFDSVPDLKGLKLLTPLYNHISRRQTLRILYQSFSARQPQEYVLCPYLLKEFRNRWFLFGGRWPDLTMFNLALDRIISIEPADEPYRENPNFDSAHFFDDVIGVSKNLGNKPQTIRFWASASQSKYIITKPLHPSQKLINVDAADGSHVFEMRVVVNFEMFSVFLSYGEGVKILSPESAARHMKKILREALDGYESANDTNPMP